MVVAVLSYNSSQSKASVLFDFESRSTFRRPCYANKSLTRFCHNLKFPVPSNLPTSNLAPELSILILVVSNNHRNSKGYERNHIHKHKRFNEVWQMFRKNN
ncbi:hypothetical protein GLYMA_14G184000v4 [Glycine max]|uniref:Uncharacterized protein n=1 Tax=Glycine max TaxID=3847 RepID=K7M7U8_SOYBN|nr:hypothetical protein GLYMA_14G184000v4 [Glycine max]